MADVEMSITLQITDEVKAWLAQKGKPFFRKAEQEAGLLCSKYLKDARKRSTGSRPAQEASTNGATLAHVEG